MPLIIFSAHGQVDKGEDVEFYHYGEAQEDGVEGQHADAQLPVQSPLVEVDAEDLEGQRMECSFPGIFPGKLDTYYRPQNCLQNVHKGRVVLQGTPVVWSDGAPWA